MVDRDNSQEQAARRIIGAAGKLMVISGAGMSAECGLPTFRDAGDDVTWSRMADELATARGFAADPQRVWSWYAGRRQEAERAEPHAGYRALVAWERHAEVAIVTQNVDGLHGRAGSHTVVELHGSLHRFVCAIHRHPVEAVGDSAAVPQCPVCGSAVRPDVVWFGETLPEPVIWAAAEALQGADALLVIGTSLAVSTPLSFIRLAQRRHIPIVEVNPVPALEHATAVLVGPAGIVLPCLLRA